MGQSDHVIALCLYSLFGIATPFRHLGLNIFSCPRCYITARCRGREAKNCLLVPRCHFASPHVVSAYKCRLLFCDDSNGPAICQEITIIIENIRPSADGTTLSVLNDILQNAEVHAPLHQCHKRSSHTICQSAESIGQPESRNLSDRCTACDLMYCRSGARMVPVCRSD